MSRVQSKPASHPHPHTGGVCPVVGLKSHAFCAPQESDSRSPCPALNTLANHGYLPRDGKNINVWELIFALRQGYNLSYPLATFISIVGFLMLHRLAPLSLHEIGLHGAVEHDASLVHHDTPAGHTYASTHIDQNLVDEFIDDVRSTRKFVEGPDGGEFRMLMDARDVARTRVRREKSSPELDGVHAEIARGEMAIILNVMKVAGEAGNEGVPTEWMRTWIGSERFPEGWKPTRVVGLRETVRKSKEIRAEMDRLRNARVGWLKWAFWCLLHPLFWVSRAVGLLDARTDSKSRPKESVPEDEFGRTHSRVGSADSTFSSISSSTMFSRASTPVTVVGDDDWDEKEF